MVDLFGEAGHGDADGHGFSPRPYQRVAVNSVFSSHSECDSAFVKMATGLGKSAVIAMASRKHLDAGGDVLMFAGQENLLQQSKREFSLICPGYEIGIEQGKQYTSVREKKPRIVLASKDTLFRKERLKRFDPKRFSLVAIDEAHHYQQRNKTYALIGDYFHAKKLGVSASIAPGLGDVFESLSYRYEILQAIQDGWLSPVWQVIEHIDGYDLSRVRTCADGDLNDEDLAAATKQDKPLHGIADLAIKYSCGDYSGSKNVKVIVFCPDVDAARFVDAILNHRHRLEKTGRSSFVDSRMTPDERRYALMGFCAGETRYLCNWGVCLEGFNCPEVGAIINARPTTVLRVYEQMVGRGTRPHPSIARELNRAADADARKALIAGSVKKRCIFVDLVGVSNRFKLVRLADVLSHSLHPGVADNVNGRLPKETGDEPVDVGELVRIEDQHQAAELRRKKTVITAVTTATPVDPFVIMDVKILKEPSWKKGQVSSEAQRQKLARLGMPYVEAAALSAHKASAMIEKLLQRAAAKMCSYEQSKVLKSLGESINISYADAARKIEQQSGRMPR